MLQCDGLRRNHFTLVVIANIRAVLGGALSSASTRILYLSGFGGDAEVVGAEGLGVCVGSMVGRDTMGERAGGCVGTGGGFIVLVRRSICVCGMNGCVVFWWEEDVYGLGGTQGYFIPEYPAIGYK